MLKKFVGVAAVALLAATQVSPAMGASHEVPLKGTMAGEVQFLPAPECPIGLATTSDATGVASHLGRMSMSARHCTPTGDEYGPGLMTLVAANGDELYLTYVGSAAFPEPGTVFIEGPSQATVTGGTGRFAGAQGHLDMWLSLEFQGFEDPSWPATWTWTGMISY